MEKQITKKDNLLNSDGTLKNIGYSTKMLLKYNKEDVKKKGRIKEWDYYLIEDHNFVLCLTISNLSYAAALSVSVIDIGSKQHYDKTSIDFFPKKKDFMPQTSLKDATKYSTKDASFVFDVVHGKRTLKGKFTNFYKKPIPDRDLEFEIIIDDEDGDSIVKSTKFKNKHQFYYNHKKNCMNAQGYFTFKGKKYTFESGMTLATLDWGRGVLPYKSEWKWASLQYRLNKNKIGLNLGCDFGNNEEASENAIFVNGKIDKVEDVKIYITKEKHKHDYMSSWTFYSSDGKVELVFEPLVDRYAPFNALVLAFIPHQVFGFYSGKLTLADGKTINLNNVFGFAERVVNRW